MSKTLDHDSFIDGVFYKAGSPVPPRKDVPSQVAPTEELTADMTVDELIDHFRKGRGPKGASAIVDLLDTSALNIKELTARLDARNSSDTDAAQLIATANRERDEAKAEVVRVEALHGNVVTERDAAMDRIGELQKERDELKALLDEATAKAPAKGK